MLCPASPRVRSAPVYNRCVGSLELWMDPLSDRTEDADHAAPVRAVPAATHCRGADSARTPQVQPAQEGTRAGTVHSSARASLSSSSMWSAHVCACNSSCDALVMPCQPGGVPEGRASRMSSFSGAASSCVSVPGTAGLPQSNGAVPAWSAGLWAVTSPLLRALRCSGCLHRYCLLHAARDSYPSDRWAPTGDGSALLRTML